MSGDTAGDLLSTNGDEELLHESARTRIVRVVDPAGHRGVICKEFLGSEAQRRLRHERTILERLSGVDGVVPPVGDRSSSSTLTLEDTHTDVLGAALADGPLPSADLFTIAIGLAEVVAAVHGRGVTHRDINPSNILWSASPPHLYLIDFDLATTSAQELPGFVHEREITGALAYLAPEQTGRTGRPVDQRADLYGIGATLYELATGKPPFGFTDPLQLVHDHLTEIPVPPSERNPAVPSLLSDIILRLLEKEPDRRYQSAEGLAHDLRAARTIVEEGSSRRLVLGERDFPVRLSAPSRLVGRDAEIDALRDALQGARAGTGRSLLASGVPGVGKSALLDQLRPLVTGCGGWFVMGKFDQYRQDWEVDGVRRALRWLGRLLLAAPEEEIVDLRERLLTELGSNAELVAAMVPEFTSVLRLPSRPAEGDPTTVHTRLNQAAVDLLRVVASPSRPIVIAVDDLQWAQDTSLGFLDALLLDERLRDVLVVGAYRDNEVDAAHPLTAFLARWDRLGVAPTRLTVTNLPRPALGTMLSEMLRIAPEEAAPLAEAIGSRTDGNPFDTVELVNSLRREGALAMGPLGWSWDATTLRRHLGHDNVVGILVTRLAALPRRTQELLEIMACLGGEVDTDLLGDASALPTETVEERLLPALEDGLLVYDHGDASARFRHDRVQQATLTYLGTADRAELQLVLARRLAPLPGRELIAAEQYLGIAWAVDDPKEQRRLVEVFRTATAGAIAMADYGRAERYVSAAMALIPPSGPVAVDAATAAEMAVELHTVLYSLGRLDELDDAFGKVTESTDDVLVRADAAQLQVVSLTNQNRMAEALDLGFGLLRELGAGIPDDPDELAREIDRSLATMDRWVAGGDEVEHLLTPRCTDPRILATARFLDRFIPTAFFSNHPAWPLLGLTAARLWAGHGAAAELAGPVCYSSFATITRRDDYRTGNAAVRQALVVSETQGWEPVTSHIRAAYALSCAPWSEPLEDVLRQARQAHESLVRNGELQHACHTYYSTLPALFDSAATLEEVMAEVDAAMAFTARTGNDHAGGAYLIYRQFAGTLRGGTDDSCGVVDGAVDDDEYLPRLAANPTAAAYFHAMRALSAAVLDRPDDLVRHATAVAPLMPFIGATYITTTAHLVQALALVHRLRAAPPDRESLLAAFDTEREWLTARAVDVPATFSHLRRWMDAELIWLQGEPLLATRSFDALLADLTRRPRLWHRALIAERAALLHEENGLRHLTTMTLLEARSVYERWGATAKVADLDARHPELRKMRSRIWTGSGGRYLTDSGGSGTYSTDEIDLLGVVKTSQALSSETSTDRLLARVKAVLSSMTGATSVRMALRDDAASWVTTTDDGQSLTVEAAAERGLLPLTAFRYAERVQEPVVVDDVQEDERFNRDPYFAGVRSCSLLVIPILSQGRPRAILILENRLSRAAFAADHLDGVMLITGQLSVSLDNALLYASLERKVAERTEALGVANRRLETLSATDALTGLSNRRHLKDLLDDVWREALRRKSPIAIAMIDIDHFKLFNDRYGHPAGDRCLRLVAAALGEKIRGSDTVARYGGEEFIIVMPGVDIVIAERVAERVRKAVAALDHPHESSPMGIVTVSIGVTAVVPTPEGTPEALVEFADHLLYQAKRGGRNRIAVERLSAPAVR
ncbi:MAG: hypothetical protein QG622_2781 [Actinomycetota bacterium]|nr:hypothetical protein [Actinomycetota bacterium]